ncbi:MAG: hypothetical protein IIU11_05275, partial [Bacteroidales bacterium]|nr:hypothetical protein [Bacteroidales bacterium]
LHHLPGPDALVHDPQGLGGFRGDDDAAGAPVDPVAENFLSLTAISFIILLIAFVIKIKRQRKVK